MYQASTEFWGLVNILCNPPNIERKAYHGHLLSGRCEGHPLFRMSTLPKVTHLVDVKTENETQIEPPEPLLIPLQGSAS